MTGAALFTEAAAFAGRDGFPFAVRHRLCRGLGLRRRPSTQDGPSRPAWAGPSRWTSCSSPWASSWSPFLPRSLPRSRGGTSRVSNVRTSPGSRRTRGVKRELLRRITCSPRHGWSRKPLGGYHTRPAGPGAGRPVRRSRAGRCRRPGGRSPSPSRPDAGDAPGPRSSDERFVDGFRLPVQEPPADRRWLRPLRPPLRLRCRCSLRRPLMTPSTPPVGSNCKTCARLDLFLDHGCNGRNERKPTISPTTRLQSIGSERVHLVEPPWRRGNIRDIHMAASRPPG